MLQHTSLIALLLVATAGLGGCATEVRRREKGPIVGSGGAASELVFPGGEVAARVALADSSGASYAWPENSRRNGSLNARGDDAGYPIDSWPAPARASLDRARRISISTSRNASSFIYFQQGAPSAVYSPGDGWSDWRGW